MEKWIETQGTMVWNCCIISGHYGKSFESYAAMLMEARKDFSLEAIDAQCLEVVNSIRCEGNSMLAFQIPVGSEIPEGWTATSNLDELRR